MNRDITAAELAASLDGHREGRAWRCRCPVHDGGSLIIKDAGGGFPLFHCFGGCEQDAVLTALRHLGLWSRDRGNYDPARATEHKRQAEAKRNAEVQRIKRAIETARIIYRRAVFASEIIGRYLRSRGITLPVPECLRFEPHCRHRYDPRYEREYYPALVAPVVNVTGQLIAVHKTFLRPDGSGKADLPKKLQREFIGPVLGGAVRLAEPEAGRELVIGEGIENALAAMELIDLPGWAALSADGIKQLDLSGEIPAVMVAADHDMNGVGGEAALFAHRRWSRDGRQVRIAMPDNPGTDFNDILLSRAK